jgi:hypothetical protein
MKALLQLGGLLVSASTALAQSGVAVPKDVLILQSTHEYAAALAGAKQAATRLHRPFESGGNHPHPSAGLTLRKADCAANGYEYPCYSPRGQGEAENSDYISIEYSDGYLGFAKGYYLVVAALTTPNSATQRQLLTRVHQAYPTAYLKRTSVWFGCMR